MRKQRKKKINESSCAKKKNKKIELNKTIENFEVDKIEKSVKEILTNANKSNENL